MFLDESLQPTDKAHLAHEWKMSWVTDVTKADVFVVEDVSSVDERVELRCALVGLTVMSSQCLKSLGKEGGVLEFMPYMCVASSSSKTSTLL